MDYYPKQADRLPVSGIKWLGWFVLFLLVAVIVFYHLPSIGVEWRLVRTVKWWWLMVALGSQGLTYWFSALVYLTLLHTDPGARVPNRWTMMKSCIVSLFFNETVPSAGISGNTFIYRLLNRFGFAPQAVFSLILSELLIFYAAMITFFLLLLMGSSLLYALNHKVIFLLLTGIEVYLVFSSALVLAAREGWMHWFVKTLDRWPTAGRSIKRWLSKLLWQDAYAGTYSMDCLWRDHRRAVGKAYGWQLLVVAADAATIYTLFIGLGIPIHPIYCLIALAGARIAALLPFLPGGLLLYEGTMSYCLVALGISAADALLITLLYRLLSFWLPIPIGLFLFRRWKSGPGQP